jgi:cytochrome b
MMTTTTEPTRRILVWDVPTRVFHWTLALCFAAAFVTADSERYRDVHVALGYSLLGLVLFRVVWGLVGSRYARFSSFPLRPSAVKNYLASLLTDKPEHHLGHNPAGSYAVLALLAFAAASSITGYLTYNEVIGDDPHEVVANLMLALVAIHVAAVIVSSLLHKENLIGAMLTGFKRGHAEDGIPSGRWVLGTALVAAIVAGFATLTQASPDTGTAASADKANSHQGDRHGPSRRDRDGDDD